jgi:hypothetical protein
VRSACNASLLTSPTLCVLQILLIRSLYSYVRVLPAYRMYRASKRHGSDLFNTCYTLSTAPQQQHAAAAAGHGGGRMCQFAFSPVETATGQFEITVKYQPATTVHFLEVGCVLRHRLGGIELCALWRRMRSSSSSRSRSNSSSNSCRLCTGRVVTLCRQFTQLICYYGSTTIVTLTNTAVFASNNDPVLV